jgi:hypothetical protein
MISVKRLLLSKEGQEEWDSGSWKGTFSLSWVKKQKELKELREQLKNHSPEVAYYFQLRSQIQGNATRAFYGGLGILSSILLLFLLIYTLLT